MSLFGSNKSSSTALTTISEQNDNLQVNDAGGGIIGNGDINITGVDAGAVALAQKAQESAMSTISEVVKQSYAFVTQGNQAAYKTSADAMGLATGAMAQNTESVKAQTGDNTLKMAALAVVAAVGLGFIFYKQ
jgi:hypothetical protein